MPLEIEADQPVSEYAPIQTYFPGDVVEDENDEFFLVLDRGAPRDPFAVDLQTYYVVTNGGYPVRRVKKATLKVAR